MRDELVYGDEDDTLVRVAGLLFRAEAREATEGATVAAEPQACKWEEAEYNHQDNDSNR